jgi:hypothetical protein
MASKESRSAEKIFADMHRELRVWNPEIPESAERLDPILRILLQLYAHQLSTIDKRIDMVWDVATKSLIRSVCPESKRWPVPAHTVMRCHPLDPVVDIDPHSRFFYKEKREGGQTFFFSALRKERLISAEVRHIFIRSGNAAIDLSPSSGKAGYPPNRPQAVLPGGGEKIYIAVDYNGMPSNFANAALFLKGIPDVLRQLRWAVWYPGSSFGRFYEDSGFCPGLIGSIADMFAGEGHQIDWGGMRSSDDLFRPLQDSFIMMPEKFTSTWELGAIDEDLRHALENSGIKVPANDRFYWIRLDLPPGGDKPKLQFPFEVHFNCFIAVNKNELVLFKHTGGNRLVEVELPEDISNILEIVNVIDSSGREYGPRYLIAKDKSQKSYSLEERGNKLVLWFDFSYDLELPPDSITISYSITAGVSANGIEAGKITELYESHPGIKNAENIIPTSGAIPAKTEDQIVSEVSSRLRNRDRALSFHEISRWIIGFDPRIRRAECRNGVERAARGVRRCIMVRIWVKAESFYSDDETTLLQQRLDSFLCSRSPVNTHFNLEIIRE